jgi:hypothetical protein
LKGRREPLPKFPGQKSDFKDFANIKRLFGDYFWLKYRQITCREKEQGAMPENLI